MDGLSASQAARLSKEESGHSGIWAVQRDGRANNRSRRRGRKDDEKQEIKALNNQAPLASRQRSTECTRLIPTTMKISGTSVITCKRTSKKVNRAQRRSARKAWVAATQPRAIRNHRAGGWRSGQNASSRGDRKM
jgi:hypothetical protein